MRGVKKYNRHDIDVIDRVYDKMLKDRGIVKVYDTEFDIIYSKKYNRLMNKEAGKT